MDQASAMVEVALPDEPDLAVVRCAEGIDPYKVRLIETE